MVKVKKILPLAFLWGAGILFLMGACTGSPRTAENGVIYQLANDERVILLYPEQRDRSPRMSCQFTLLDASGSKAERQFIRDVLYRGSNPEKYKARIVRDYENEYFEMRALAKQNPDAPPPESLQWFYTETMEADMIPSRGAVIRRDRDYYTGGAHGMRNREYLVLDLREMKKLDLEDVIKPGSRPALAREVEAALRNFSNLAGDEPLSQGYYFEDTIEPSRNFFLSSQGLGFHWDPYEIAPYVVGPVEILIPYDRAAKLLTPRALSLMAAPGI